MATTYLSKTLGSGNKDKWTWSAWVKRHSTGAIHPLFHSDDGGSNYYTHISFHDTDQLFFQNRWNNGNDGYKITTRVFRDTNAWYHLQFVWDSGNATADDRQIIYVNGERLTGFGGANVAVTQNRDTTINDGYEHRIGRGGSFNGSAYADVTMSHVHFADGQAYAPTVFGETDSTTGEWKIKTTPSVTYGTNGFFILKNGNSVTDQSGNSNNWTVAAGTLGNTEDNPSNVFPILNQLNPQATGYTFDGLGGLSVTGNTGDAWRTMYATFGARTGKYYWEQKITNFTGVDPHYIGIVSDDQMSNSNIDQATTSRGYFYTKTGAKRNNNSQVSYGDSWTTNDIVGIALDLDNSKLYFSKNGTWQDSGDPTSGSTGTGAAFTITSGYTYIPATSTYYNLNRYAMNFGNGSFGTSAIASEGTNASNIGKFEYDVPTGYTALCTKGLNE